MFGFVRRYGPPVLLLLAIFLLSGAVARQIYRGWKPGDQKTQQDGESEAKTKQWNEKVGAALKAAEGGETDKALEILVEAESFTPETQKAYELLSGAFADLGDNVRAIKNKEKAALLLPETETATMEHRCNVVQGYHRLGRLEEALRVLNDHVLPIWPDSFQGNYLQTILLLEQKGKEELALKHIQRAMQQKPDLAGIRYQYALCLARLDRLAEARKTLEKVVADHPHYAVAQHELARVLHRMGEGDAAKLPLKKFQELDEKRRRRDILLTHVALKRAKSEHLLELAQIFLDTKSYADARRALQKYIVSKPDDPAGHRMLARVLRGLEKPDLADAEQKLADALQIAAKAGAQGGGGKPSTAKASEQSQ